MRKDYYKGIVSLAILKNDNDNDNDNNYNNDDNCDNDDNHNVVSFIVVVLDGPFLTLVPMLLILYLSLLFVAFLCFEFDILFPVYIFKGWVNKY